MVEGVEISIFFDNTHKKYHILAGILSFVFMKKFAYRTEDSDMYTYNLHVYLSSNKEYT